MGECRELLDSTEAILMEFKKQGGKIVSTDYFPESDLVSDKEIKYKLKYKGNNKIHFFTNSTPDEKSVKIKVNGKKLNIYSGKWEEFSGVHDFEPWGSLLLLEDGSENLTYIKAEENYIYPEGEFKIISKDLNLITLDKCDYYFDEELQEENGYVLNICERANKLEREVQIRWVYKVKAKYKPEKLYLITETPEKFNIKVNGIEINKKVQGYYKDISFKKIDIAEYFTEGENEITFNCSFIQAQRFYEHLKRAKRFEGEINMLYYDIEIEPVYLLGDFSVKTDGKWQKLERNDYRYTGEFIIDKPVNSLVPKNIEQKGFPFFSGEMILEGEIDVQGKNPVLNLKSKGINVIGAIVGDINETKLTDYKISLASLGNGKRKLRLRIVNNLHNMMGPHHLEVGQSYIAGPFCFYKEDCVWSKTFLSGPWNDDYCFAEFGFDFE